MYCTNPIRAVRCFPETVFNTEAPRHQDTKLVPGYSGCRYALPPGNLTSFLHFLVRLALAQRSDLIMARLFPPELPSLVLNDSRRSAERRFYVECGRLLPDSMSVFYGVTWLAKKRGGDARDGEADFVLVDRDGGLLVIEVKGGQIGLDGRTGKWSSRDRDGVAHPIENPVEQAKRNRYALLEKIHMLPGWGNHWVPIGHAVAFPDCVPEHGAALLDLPEEIAIFQDSLRWLPEKIGAIYRFWQSEDADRRGLDEVRLRILERTFAPQLATRVPLGTALREEERQIVQLTEQQRSILDGLKRHRRVAISGGAGTGKTFLAVEKAKALAEEGYRTLLTCFNKGLGDYLRASVGERENLTVKHFHLLCDDVAKAAGVVPRGPAELGSDQEFFDRELPEALTKALEISPSERFDAIVVDEGQDFSHADWWVALQLTLGDPDDGILYVFHDANQNLFSTEGGAPEGLTSFDLTENLRNTQTIHALASRYYDGDDQRAVGPEGRPVEFIEANGEQAIRRELSKVLHHLIKDMQVPAEDIAILSGHRPEKGPLAGLDRIGAFELTESTDPEPGKVTFVTIHRFKGLERPVVVLLDIDSYIERATDEILYVGLTRARSHLVVIGGAHALEALNENNSEKK